MQPTDNVNRIGAACLAATGALHLVLAPEYLSEQAYIGVLFIAGGIVALLLALRMWRSDEPVIWAAAALIAAGMGVGFVLSRTVGLPGFHEEEWELSGLLSLALEAGVVASAVAVIRTPRAASTA